MEKRFSLRVNIVYQGYDQVLDTRIRTIAKKYKGSELGAGFGFGARDVDYEFSNMNLARAFCNDLYKAKIKFKPTVTIEDMKE